MKYLIVIFEIMCVIIAITAMCEYIWLKNKKP